MKQGYRFIHVGISLTPFFCKRIALLSFLFFLSTKNIYAQAPPAYIGTACGLNYVHGDVMIQTRTADVNNKIPGTGIPTSVTISGIPPSSCNVIEIAYLYFSVSYKSATAPVASVTITNPLGASNTYNSVITGQSGDLGWGEKGAAAYRTTVTGNIAGNGVYNFNIAGFSDPNWEINGATLIIVYRNTTASYQGSLTLWDGALSCNCGNPNIDQSHTLTGFNACAKSTTAKAFLIVSDLQEFLYSVPPYSGHQTTLNGVTATYPNNFWNWDESATTVNAGQTTAQYGIQVPKVGFADCYTICLTGLYYQTTSCVTCNPPLILTTTNTPASCSACNGGASVSATGGTAPYKYSWNTVPAQTTAMAVNLCSGTYTVTVTDVSGCISSATTVTLNPTTCGPAITATGGVICSGGCINIATTASGGTAPYTYSWNTGATTSSLSVCPTATTTYTITLSDGSSKNATATAVVTVNPSPILNVTGNTTICNGTSTTLTASGANTYAWSPGTGLSTTTNATVNANPTTTTTYTITGVTSGCTGTTTVEIIVNPNPAVNITPVTICQGNSATLSASGSTTYAWSPATGLSATTGTSVVANPTTTTTYTVIGSFASGCSASGTVIVTVNPPCGPGVSATGSTVCEGICATLTSTASGGIPPYTYSWDTGETTASISNCPSVTTTYTVTVTDNSVPTGTASAIAVITVNPNPVVVVPAATICAGTSTVLTASGATTYTWAPALGLNTTSGTTVTANPNITTTYTVTGSNLLGCTATTTVVLTINPIPLISVPNASICSGGTTVLSATGANSYTWGPSNGLSATTGATVTANPITNSTYTVCGSSNGCSSCTTVTVNVGKLVATISPNKTICFGNSTNLIASGGSTYSWTPKTNLDNPNIFNPIATPTVTTTYTVVVSDSTCSNSAVVTITVNPAISLNVAPINATCFGRCNGQTIVIPSGGTSPYIYSWSGGCSSAACNNVCAGSYTLTVTDAMGCTNSGVVTVTEPLALTMIVTGGNACLGDSITLSATGATSYSWFPATGLYTNSGATVIAKPTQTTTYTITGTDANGCTTTAITTATVNPKPNAAFTNNPQVVNEFNPTIYFNDHSFGGTITSWKWNFGDPKKTTSTIQNPWFTYPDTSNHYQVGLIVTNQFGCIDSITATIYIRGIFTFYIPNTFTPDGNGLNDGFLPKGVGIDETNYHLWIFDRWGNLIWHTETWGEAWDGKANKGSDIAQLDTYVWKVYVKEKETGINHNYVGHVNIVK
ncbi:MAG: gliding motility-associated C-terminal domain-containing protein [Bacteroidetes bacterium]|nr:gliding motility-associated C-terminal domain-containing protein [Bacteroidota bacterium]